MAEETVLVAQTREGLGSSECRRLRNSGYVPGNVYGHGKDTLNIKTSHEDVVRIVKEGHISVDLDMGDSALEKAIFREVQWDTFGKQIIHFDLLRVDRNETIEIEVPVVLKGTAPGVAQGGILDLQLHTLSVSCLVYKIPDTISVRVGTLLVGDSIRVEDLTLPDGVEVSNPPDKVVVQVSEPRALKTEEEAQETGDEDTDIEPSDEQKEGESE